MLIVPGNAREPIVTRHSRELGRRVEQLVRDYKRDNPGMTDEEVRSALTHTMMESVDEDALRRRRVGSMVAVALAVAVAGVGAAVSARNAPTNQSVWVVFACIAAIAGAAIAVRRLRGRF